jgi:hypothetical protein
LRRAAELDGCGGSLSFRRQAGAYLADPIENLLEMAVTAIREFLFFETSERAEMPAHGVKRASEMGARRQVLGEQILKVAQERTGLRIAFETLPICLVLAAVRDTLQRVQAPVNCHPMLVRECGRRH